MVESLEYGLGFYGMPAQTIDEIDRGKENSSVK
jgi:hypothetical protein